MSEDINSESSKASWHKKTHFKHVIPHILILLITIVSTVVISASLNTQPPPPMPGAPPYGEAESDIPSLDSWQDLMEHWERPVTPPKVALQVGHLNNHEVPEELDRIRGNTGAQAGGHTEVSVNQAIAETTAELLRAEGITVDILPATVPPDYWADVFIAIHADGSTDTSVSGYKIASPWRDLTGKSASLVSSLEEHYEDATGLRQDPNITRNMRGYYAFAWWRYEHSIHPMTTAAIVETGFLTNRSDRQLLAETPEIPAQALADGIVQYLQDEGLMEKAKKTRS